jgi:mannose-6-phosphate isomerase-like protein (cupin superfamily)
VTTLKAAAAQTAGAYSMEDLAPRGSGTPLHRHREDDEEFYILAGDLTFYLGNDQPIQASAGSFVHIPGGTVHAFRVDSETARYLIITTLQHERFYRAIAEPAQTRSTCQRPRWTWRRSGLPARPTGSRASAPLRKPRPSVDQIPADSE